MDFSPPFSSSRGGAAAVAIHGEVPLGAFVWVAASAGGLLLMNLSFPEVWWAPPSPSSSRGGRRPTWRSIRTWGLHRRGRPRRPALPYGLPRSLRSLAVTGVVDSWHSA